MASATETLLPLKIVTLTSREQIHSQEFIDREWVFPARDFDRRYIVYWMEDEVAILWLELWEDSFLNFPHAQLYEIFIARNFRRRGVGSSLIQMIKEIVLSEGMQELVVLPRPLSDDFSSEELQEWYRKRGFIEIPNQPSLFKLSIQTISL